MALVKVKRALKKLDPSRKKKLWAVHKSREIHSKHKGIAHATTR